MSHKEKLEAALTSLTLAGDLEIRPTADSLEAIQNRAARDVDATILTNQTVQAKALRKALAKIGTGEWGVCEECEGEISEGRLRAVPWANLCLRCQEYEERQAKDAEPEARLEKRR